jgi:L-amino acid N-acyltransferase YncA
MSIELALDKYHIKPGCGDGHNCEIRPLVKEDEQLIKDFYLKIPEYERLFIKRRVNDGEIFHDWCENIDYESNLPLLAIRDGIIIAEATLHQRQGGWKRHIGLVSELTHPDFRGKGLSEILLREIIELAQHAGLRKLETEINGERDTAIHGFAEVGFQELARVPNYVQDMDLIMHDYVLMGMDISTPEEYAGLG